MLPLAARGCYDPPVEAGATPIELSVIVPCYNEEGNLPELVERTERVFEQRRIRGELVLVNDGSRDRTGAQIEALAGRHACIVGVHHPTNRGIPAGWRSGFERSRGRYLCTIDADLQYQPEAIALLHREMRFSRADLVQGWRSTLERQHDHRYYLSRGLDYLLKLAFAMPEHDVKSGFVLYRREVFEDLLREAHRFHYFQHMITVVAKAKGYSIRQVETLFAERHAGQSFIGGFPVTMMSRTIVDIGAALVAYRLRELPDDGLAAAPVGLAAAPAPAARHPPAAGATRNAPGYLEQLRRSQWLPREALEALQMRRLRRLVAHAADRVGYWRELLHATGVTADDLQSLDDLRRLPILTKSAARENAYFDLLSDGSDKRKIVKIATSGNAGEPLGLFLDRLQRDTRWANAARHREWAGWTPGARWLRAGRGTSPSDEALSFTERARRMLASGEPVIAADVVDARLRQTLVERVRRDRPAVFEADAEVLQLLAAEGGSVEPWGRRIVSTGQTLAPGLRAEIEERLGAPVLDRYGAREFGPLAQQCEAGGWHVNAESVIVEVWRDGRPAGEGEVGDILVTDLTNRCMPLLRYRLGDVAVATTSSCPCGRGLPMLGAVGGRRPASIQAGPGRRVPASAIGDRLAPYDFAVQRWQIVQPAPDRVVLRLVRRLRYTPATGTAIRDALGALLGDRVELALEPVEDLAGAPPVVPLPEDVAPQEAAEQRRHAAGPGD